MSDEAKVISALRKVYFRLFAIAGGATVKAGEIEDLLKREQKGEDLLGPEKTIALLELCKRAWVDEGNGCPMTGSRDPAAIKLCLTGVPF